jgi:triosephosphate isomerase
MDKGLKIKAPFFEIGPKAYLYGEQMLALAKVIDRVAKKYDVQVIVTPQYTDISLLSSQTENILVFAQHMDSLPVGRGLGSVLPEAVKAAGAVGVMLNHAEKQISLSQLAKTIRRADEVGLATIVCADSIAEVAAVAQLSPNIIVAEPSDLIGSGQTSNLSYVKNTIELVHKINPDIMVLQGAGISTGKDVYDVIMAGAEATGCTSGIIKAADPAAMTEEMLYSLRAAWDKLHGSSSYSNT